MLCGHNPSFICGCVDSRYYLLIAHHRPIGQTTTSTSLSRTNSESSCENSYQNQNPNDLRYCCSSGVYVEDTAE
jgi:hypothetical protein